MPLFVPKDRKSLFRQFLAGMYDAVVITDPNGHIIEINPRAEEHFGYSQDEVIDRPISFFIPGLGQICDGDWGRGFAFLAGNVGLNLLANAHEEEYVDEYGNKKVEVDGAWALLQAARLVVNIWAICDAVRVAKIKNMYYQDMNGRYSSVSARFEPFLSCVPSGNQQNTAALGMSFKVSF